MITLQTATTATPSFDKLKMEDRKRSLANDADDLAPGRKRVLKDENGQQMRMDAEKEKDVENYQKDAILRQMKEYKRQKKDLEEQYERLKEKSRYYDDHLRTIDVWWAQLIDEVRVLVAQINTTPPHTATSTSGVEMYKSALLFENNEKFSEHLRQRSENIKGTINDLFGRLPSAQPEVESLRGQLNDLLAKEKSYVVELRQITEERDAKNDSFERAVARYMVAERKLDKAKSAQVQKLERAATMSGSAEGTSPTTAKKSATPNIEQTELNGQLENGVSTAEVEGLRKELAATGLKQKAQIEEIEAENERLTNELSAARTRLISLTDDDYAETSLFKTVKSQYEDVTKRQNDSEAANKQLREDNQKLHSERTTFRAQVDEEHRKITEEDQTQIARTENDLTRVRDHRDNLLNEINLKKAAEENHTVSAQQAKELAEARESRIAALELQVERLRTQTGEVIPAEPDLDQLDPEELRTRLRSIEAQHMLLSNELPSMEKAWRKTSALAARKIEEIANMEEQISRYSAEKTKADQKYFATMKVNDAHKSELRSVKTQNARSSEIVSQLKETDSKTRELVSNLERQTAESKDSLTKLTQQLRTAEQKLKEEKIGIEDLQKQIASLKTMVSAKDKDSLTAAKSRREAEEELERTKARLEDLKKQHESLRKARVATSNADSDDWRKVAICPVCNANIRNTFLKNCGHVFCSPCVQGLISNRSRKCPTCGRAFGNSDQMSIVLT